MQGPRRLGSSVWQNAWKYEVWDPTAWFWISGLWPWANYWTSWSLLLLICKWQTCNRKLHRGMTENTWVKICKVLRRASDLQQVPCKAMTSCTVLGTKPSSGVWMNEWCMTKSHRNIPAKHSKSMQSLSTACTVWFSLSENRSQMLGSPRKDVKRGEYRIS